MSSWDTLMTGKSGTHNKAIDGDGEEVGQQQEQSMAQVSSNAISYIIQFKTQFQDNPIAINWHSGGSSHRKIHQGESKCPSVIIPPPQEESGN